MCGFPGKHGTDIISTVTPGITLDITGRPAGLTLIYAPSFVTYADDSYDDYWRHQASGRLVAAGQEHAV
jgi:hypothetical protein